MVKAGKAVRRRLVQTRHTMAPEVEHNPSLVPLRAGESVVESEAVWQQRKAQEFATATDQMLALPVRCAVCANGGEK